MKFIDYIFDNINKALLYAAFLVLSFFVVYISTRMNYKLGLLFSMIPVFIIFFIIMVKNPYFTFLFLFTFNYLVMGLSRYVKVVSPGIALDFVLVTTLLAFFLNSFYKASEIKLSKAFNGLTFLAFIWFIYCMFQILNPNLSSTIAWFTGVRNLGVYFILVVILASIILSKDKRVYNFIFAWSILALLAVAKAMVQKFIGFDVAELKWLYLEGGSVTHVLYYGIRYFSFFTDAANFGTGIAFSAVVFAIIALFFKERKLKIYYVMVSIACLYGMIISGTRGSLAVPFVGLTVFVLLSKNIRYITLTIIVLSLSFAFLKFTNYGQGNSYVRRMRSVFNKDDPSLKIRLVNQARLRTYMWKYPFGIGIAMSRPGATTYKPNPIISNIPSDSWYVRVWMELGIVGLLIHVFILLYIVVYGAFLALFRLKDPRLRGVVIAIVCGLSGVYIAAYSLEIIGQLPNSIIMYVCMAIIFISPNLDKSFNEDSNALLSKLEHDSYE